MIRRKREFGKRVRNLEKLEDRYLLASDITIHAAGLSGQETMQLQIDGAVVQTWNNVGGNYIARQFLEFDYTHPQTITADQVRVAFTNDAGGRNLRVDKITLDSQDYEAEDPSVFSTGTWTSATNCAPGNKQNEQLHCNGYLQFASNGTGPGALEMSESIYSVDEDAGAVTVQVNRTGGAAGSVSVNYATSNGAATAGSDYQSRSGTLTFADGETSKTVNIPIINDGIAEPNQTFNFTLSNPTGGATLGSGSSTIRILDDDSGAGSVITIYAAGLSGQERMELQIDGAVVQAWNNVGGNYISRQFLTFTHNATSLVTADQVRVAFVNDAGGRNLRVDKINIDGIDYEAEDPSVFSTGTWTSATNCAPGNKQNEQLHCNGYLQFASGPSNPGQIALIDTLFEVDEDAGNVTIELERTGGSSGSVSVNYATSNGTASAGSDYSSRTGTLTFANGVTSRTINVPIINDSVDEPNETFNFSLSNPTGGASLGTNNSTVRIIDNDTAGAGSAITIYAAGLSGNEIMQLQIDGTVVQTWNNVGGNYIARQFQTYVYNSPSTVSADQIRVAFVNDASGRNLRVDKIDVDGNEYEAEDPSVFSTGTWKSATGCAPGNKQSEELHCNGYFEFSTGIQNPGQLSVASLISVDESVGNLALQVQRTGGDDGQVSVDYATNNGSATAGSDYGSVSGQLVFAPGETSKVINIPILEDATDEPNQNFTLTLSSPTGGATIGTGTSDITIVDNDNPGANGSVITIYAAGLSGQERMELQIDGNVVRAWNNVGGNYIARQFLTYTHTTSSTITADQIRVAFVNDANGRNLRVDKIDVDGLELEAEAASVFSTGTWNSATGCAPGNKQSEELHCNGYFEFNYDPGVLSLSTTQLTLDEDSGTAQLTVTRTGGSDGPAQAFYQTLGVEATDGADFIGVAEGVVNFADGQTTGTITVPLINDGDIEPAETFSVSLSRAEGADLGFPRTGIVTIQDDDSLQGIVGHWRLDETSIGQSVVDSSGLGNNGLHQNLNSPFGPTADTPDVSSTNTRGLSLDGVDDYVSIPSDSTLNLSGGFTQSVWIKPQIDDQAYHGVLGYQPGSTAQRAPGIWVFEQTKIHAGFGDGTNWNSFITGDVLTQNQWNHVATSFDGTTYRVFANGVNVYSTSDFAGLQPFATTQIDIGRIDNYFEGVIDDVRIYNRALSPLEVSLLIDGATVPPIPTSGEFIASSLYNGFDTPIEVDWLPDGRMLVAEQDGYVRVVNTDGTVQSTPLLDITSIVNAGTKDRGMIGFAVHPDFDNNPYIYASYTYDPPEVNGNSGLGGPDGNGARVARISRFTVNAAGTFADPNSDFVLVGNNSTYANIGAPNIRPGLGDPHSCISGGNPIQDCIPADETSHTIGELEFGPDGMLHIASGDGGAFGRVEPTNMRALDLNSLAGKILRVDPITGQAPSDNPYYQSGNPNSNQSKVYAYGLRNPFRLAIDDAGEVFIGDVGWTQWEEINTGAGANFGWPAFEGGNGTSLQTGGYNSLPEVQAYYASNPNVTAPAWARLHSDGARAIVMGEFATSNYPPEYDGALLFTDIGDEIIRVATFDASGNISNVEIASGQLGFIIDMAQGPDDYIYYVDITGSIGRLDFQVN